MPKFGIVLGSTRKGRAGEEVAQWVAEQVAGRDAIMSWWIWRSSTFPS